MLEFRLDGGAAIAARAWREGNAIYASPDTLAALGIAAADGDRIALSSVPGLSYRFDAAQQAVLIQCAAACFPARRLGPWMRAAPALSATRGLLFDIDLSASWVDGENHAAGAFALAAFTGAGDGDVSWTAGAGGEEIVRLETRWSIDFPARRTRLAFGDALAPHGPLGAPLRFGGVRFGTDFALDPRLVTFETPTFVGEADAASVVELYVDGALRLRERVAQGPFAIVEAPVASGAGTARLVVTDVMGRERVIEAPFYAAPSTLRRGLAAWDVSIGAERRGYGRRSFDYGRGFAAGAYRRGLGGATIGVRGDVRENDDGIGGSVGGSVSFADAGVGQIDVDVGASHDDAGAGGFAQLSWSRQGRATQASLQALAAEPDYRALGAHAAAPRLTLRGAFGLSLRDGGDAAINAALIEPHEGPRRAVYGLSYSNTLGAAGAFGLTALAVEESERSVYVGLSFTRAFGADGVAVASAEHDGRGVTAGGRVSHTPPRGGGLAWRAGAATGARPRGELGLAARSAAFEARLDAARAGGGDGLRAQFATTLAAIDGAWAFTAPASEAFALVDVGAAAVTVRHDGRIVGRTDKRGRLMFAGLRPYDINRIGLSIDDLPLHARVDADEAIVRPAGRGGIAVRFDAREGAAGEVRIMDARGAPLPRGTMLVRDGDGARFPVGADGRLYLSGVTGASVLRGGGCVVRLGAQHLGATATCGESGDDP